jgi:hypothetical protein
MIPASYLFKTAYDNAWTEPDAPIVAERRANFLDGHLIPMTGAIIAVLNTLPHPTQRRRGGHAWQ